MPSPYEVLSISQDAGPDEIRKAYRALALQWHPDKHAGDKAAEEMFKNISSAYAILSDLTSKAELDSRIKSSGSATVNIAFSEVDVDRIFLQEMIDLASELTMANVRYRKIARYLIEAGCPERVALQIAREIETKRKRLIRDQARLFLPKQLKKMGIALAVGLVGVPFYFISMLQFIGYILSGIAGLVLINYCYQLLRILYFGISGKAPMDSATVATRLFKE